MGKACFSRLGTFLKPKPHFPFKIWIEIIQIPTSSFLNYYNPLLTSISCTAPWCDWEINGSEWNRPKAHKAALACPLRVRARPKCMLRNTHSPSLRVACASLKTHAKSYLQVQSKLEETLLEGPTCNWGQTACFSALFFSRVPTSLSLVISPVRFPSLTQPLPIIRRC